MRVAHISLDEVNRTLVARWAKGVGVRVARRSGAGQLRADGAGAVVLDLDHLPADVRAGWVRRAVTEGVGCPVLAHGHNVADAEAAALRRSGVRVCAGRVRRAAVRGWLRSVAGAGAVN